MFTSSPPLCFLLSFQGFLPLFPLPEPECMLPRCPRRDSDDPRNLFHCSSRLGFPRLNFYSSGPSAEAVLEEEEGRRRRQATCSGQESSEQDGQLNRAFMALSFSCPGHWHMLPRQWSVALPCLLSDLPPFFFSLAGTGSPSVDWPSCDQHSDHAGPSLCCSSRPLS